MHNFMTIVGLAFMVSLANIGLNFLIARSASAAVNWQSLFASNAFAVAILLGIVSLSFMSLFYYVGRHNQIGMANGILIMGATSIVGGTLVGYFGQGAQIHWSEWCVLVLLVVFFFLRFARTLGSVVT
ncbi:hypothetical protein ACXIT0_03455 [Methylorubrum extorquens]